MCAFWKCAQLNKVTFLPGSHLTTLELKSFDMNSFTSLDLPPTVHTIRQSAIYYLPNLNQITYCGNNIFNETIIISCASLQHVIVHSAYKSNKFGNINVTKSESLICPSVIFQNSYSIIFSLKSKTIIQHTIRNILIFLIHD